MNGFRLSGSLVQPARMLSLSPEDGLSAEAIETPTAAANRHVLDNVRESLANRYKGQREFLKADNQERWRGAHTQESQRCVCNEALARGNTHQNIAEEQHDLRMWLVLENILDKRHHGCYTAAGSKEHINTSTVWITGMCKLALRRKHLQAISRSEVVISIG